MAIQKIAGGAAVVGFIIGMVCLMSYIPDADAVIFGNETVNQRNIGEAALCVAPLGLSFILAIIAALGGE